MITSTLNRTEKISLNAVIEDLKKGGSEGLKFIFKNYSALFYSIAKSYSNNPEIVKDLVQEGIVKVFYNIDKYRKGNFEGWMKRIITNYCIDYTRSAQAKHDKLAEYSIKNEYEEENQFKTNQNNDDELLLKDIKDSIELLPNGYKSVLKYYCIEGYSHKEIGEKLGIEASSSRSQLMKAKNKLKEILKEKEVLA